MVLPPLVLTGGPAAGKSTTARLLSRTKTRSAFIDVDDVRQLVQTGGAAPWDDEEGIAQQGLGVRNAATLAGNFLSAGFDVTLADVITSHTLPLYRALLPGVIIVRLSLPVDDARRRAAQRTVYLTDAEFDALHRQQLEPLAVDYDVDVRGMRTDEQVDTVGRLWRRLT
ncbi:hypothetical protein [Ornithinimicrobium cerasi]|uniref:hypothetical protein n=1 Tax=Ornithinimicrobium cerasi TaxID=2248773 RepID=UPI000EFF101D|nr:hypothetical protein [Ornithinimicrobium cerasi]